MNGRFLIANTTREERERIVMEALGGEAGCEDSVSDRDIAFYQPYIDGKMELRECTAMFRSGYVKGAMERGERGTCGFAR